jgi:hypothetical protein
MSNDRNELLRDIMSTLSGPKVPDAAPKDPGPDATPAQKEAYAASVRDHAVLGVLQKPVDLVTEEERSELLRQISTSIFRF